MTTFIYVLYWNPIVKLSLIINETSVALAGETLYKDEAELLFD